ncbi:class I SAM-dependent methyltransferase [Exiguobacterium flavidum]|uniref:class I SAM-dependent methyltransferase n=1 Tax=Exiguobacterium flavidum TaxID=2184695 RepID=UPI000DF853F9|nr:methyltransferase domain-containing protein [Exiguobacterium flavidum]
MLDRRFLMQFLLRPKETGAVMPSSSYLSRKMMAPIDFEKARCIVELGAGTGIFTQGLCRNMRPGSMLIVIENNPRFCEQLARQYKGKSGICICLDGAEALTAVLERHGIEQVDYVVSGLPFASLDQMLSRDILEAVRRVLKPNGSFIAFQYTKWKREFFESHFNAIAWNRELRNFPPAYVLECRNI